MIMQDNDHRSRITHLLQSHGFRPEIGTALWSKSGRTQDAIAELPNDRPVLHLMIYYSCEDQMLFETNVDLTAADEPILERVISTFDLS